jgi:hypothetical protein
MSNQAYGAVPAIADAEILPLIEAAVSFLHAGDVYAESRKTLIAALAHILVGDA